MKRNLAVFAGAIAERAGVGLDIVPSDKAGGGKVIVVRGEWSSHRTIHDELEVSSRAASNQPVDWLFCVPGSSIDDQSRRHSDIYQALRAWGHECWDGVDPSIRKDFPRSTNEYRVVHYQSARGLEGWTVVLENLDLFWEERRRHKLALGFVGDEESSMSSLDGLARLYAWQWVLIALTRPIDSLVITLHDMDSPLSRSVQSIAQALPDIVDWRVA